LHFSIYFDSSALFSPSLCDTAPILGFWDTLVHYSGGTPVLRNETCIHYLYLGLFSQIQLWAGNWPLPLPLTARWGRITHRHSGW
jgi:hypothetical protein